MSEIETIQKKNELSPAEIALLQGDLSKLQPVERADLYNKICNSVGLNPLTRPFDLMEFRGGKLQFYANRNCTDQLRKIDNVSVKIVSREIQDDLYVVTANAKLPNGREDESVAAVIIGNVKGEARANAIMKCETKAKRRVTLSICGLSFLDETEVETIPGAKTVHESVTDGLKKTIEHGQSGGGVAYEDIPQGRESSDEELFDQSFPTDDPEPDYSSYVIPFGPFKSRTLRDLPVNDLKNYIEEVHETARIQQKEIKGIVLEFLTTASAYVRQNELE